MKTNELIAVLNEINKKFGANVQNRHVYIDAIDSPDLEYAVVEVWDDGACDVYLTDDAQDLINNHCYDDYDEYMYGLKSLVVYSVDNDGVHEYVAH